MTDKGASFVTRYRWLAATLAIVGAVVLFASLSRDPAVPVRAVTAQRGTIRSVVSTNGKVEPLQNFEAHAPMGTTVKKIWGMRVIRSRKGNCWCNWTTQKPAAWLHRRRLKSSAQRPILALSKKVVTARKF